MGMPDHTDSQVPERPSKSKREGLIPGTLNALILKALSIEPRHGYAVSKWISRTTKDTFLVEEGVMYPALHRLERAGLIESEWQRSESGRRVKFYSLTRSGRRALAEEVARWERSSQAVWDVLNADG